ncbi:MAG: Flp family type IVb pilin [Emcibacter sp.]|nr:Flp family type IVb pilin [Emcibacter sp.]
MRKFFAKLRKSEKGATAIEYGLIAALIAVAVISAMTTLGEELGTTFTNIQTELATANGGTGGGDTGGGDTGGSE